MSSNHPLLTKLLLQLLPLLLLAPMSLPPPRLPPPPLAPVGALPFRCRTLSHTPAAELSPPPPPQLRSPRGVMLPVVQLAGAQLGACAI